MTRLRFLPVFGPIMLIMSYDKVEEAIEMANSSRFGSVSCARGIDFERDKANPCCSPPTFRSLGASVYGRDKAEARYVASQLQCGMVSINDFGVFYLDQALPFGGCKASGKSRIARVPALVVPPPSLARH